MKILPRSAGQSWRPPRARWTQQSIRSELSWDWTAFWNRLGLDQPGLKTEVFRGLMTKYEEPWRFYHNGLHILDCLRELGEGVPNGLCWNPEAVEMALWFHDAICDPSAADNEERSAEYARSTCDLLDLPAAFGQRVERLVMATKNHRAKSEWPEDLRRDAAVVCDIDMAILAAPRETFDEYERRIRAEHAGIPDREFYQARAGILQRFLTRQRIYQTDLFHGQFEAAARANLRRSIAQGDLLASRRSAKDEYEDEVRAWTLEAERITHAPPGELPGSGEEI